ncbi:hypothetical protein LCGC14_1177570 [marine sediment metagenome]|uniref:Uncharacterized protein n=1 Tax=marine sediment metagenome TaxID=412755 RepID=A0A0F9P608_9ZZZZ|nr:MAG: ThiS family protein [Candidatus Lokiarchaeum sp. GC14_75]
MIVEILYFAEFKDITGKEKEKFELLNNTIKELVDLLIKKYNIQHLLWDEVAQKVQNNISIIINNEPVYETDPLLIKVNNGDTIAFLLPVSGG